MVHKLFTRLSPFFTNVYYTPGHPTIATPNLDNLARGPHGSFFTQFNVAAPICTPSRSALLTGRLPLRNGVYSNAPPPTDELFRVFYPSSKNCLTDETVADVLRKEGGYQVRSKNKRGLWVAHSPSPSCSHRSL